MSRVFKYQNAVKASELEPAIMLKNELPGFKQNKVPFSFVELWSVKLSGLFLTQTYIE